MKKMGRIILVKTIVMLFFVFVLTGCSSTEYIQVETDTAKAIYEAAYNLVKSEEGGITVNALLSGLSGRFSGLIAADLIIGNMQIIVNYQGINYIIKCEMDLSNISSNNKSAAGYDEDSAIVASIISAQRFIAIKNANVKDFKTDNITGETAGPIRIIKYDGENTAISIPSHIAGGPVVQIGNGAFMNNNMEAVIFPYLLTHVGSNAFAGNRLVAINFPNKYLGTGILIGNGAFSNNQITNLSIPDSVSIIDDSAFYGNQLTELIMSKKVRYIGDGAFGNNRLTSVNIHDRDLFGEMKFWASIIGNHAFYGNQIEDLTLGRHIISIGYSAFMGNQLEKVNIPNQVHYIGASAFEGNKISSLTIGKKVIYIGAYAFRNNQLTHITIPNNKVILNYKIDKPVFIELGDGAFDSNLLTSVEIPVNVNKIGGAPFSNNPLLTEINVHPKNKDFSSIDGVLYNKDATTLIQWPSGKHDVTIPDTVTKIGTRAFAGNQLTGITIPETVTEIGAGAFQNNQLTSVAICAAVTVIGHSSFNNNPRLTDINVSHENPNYSAMNGILLNKKGTILLQWPSAGFDITIPGYVTDIGERAFSGNRLTNVNFGNNVTHIGIAAFNGNRLARVTIPNSVTFIGDRAFANNQLTNVTIPNNITYIRYETFRNNQLTDITIPNNVTRIGMAAFADNQLSSIIFSNQLAWIGERAFTGNQLTKIIIPDSVGIIYPDAFALNRLSQINIGANVNIHASRIAGSFNESVLTEIVDTLKIQDEQPVYEDSHMINITKPDNSSYLSFREFYNENNKRAGVYTYNETDKKWSFVTR